MKPKYAGLLAFTLAITGFVLSVVGYKYDPQVQSVPGVREFYRGIIATYVVILTAIGMIWVWFRGRK